MSASASPVAISVFLAIFLTISSLGFLATHWKKADLRQLSEWGLAGRRFGPLLIWFLIGGDLYTAYTFVALPALMMGAGAFGFFSIPCSIIGFVLVFTVLPKVWTICAERGFATAADLVEGLYGSRTLALVIALTGIVATIPYIALQLVGMESILAGLGLQAHFDILDFDIELPLFIAFAVMAGFTYNGGLRAPAIIAIFKDILVWVTLIAAVMIIPAKLGGYAAIFDAVPLDLLVIAPSPPDSLGPQFAYFTLALGSALGLFLYPHTLTGLLAASSRDALRRNAIFLPLYSVALAFLMLLGFMALAAGVREMPEFADGFARFGNVFAVPALFNVMFPEWFRGVAFATIAVGAIVPAAIMSIAGANLFTRNIYRAYIDPGCSDARQTQVAKVFSLLVKVGALGFVTLLPNTSAVQFQLLGGILMCQTLPSVIVGLYVRWLHPAALMCGWAAGVSAGIAMAASTGFKQSLYALHVFGTEVPCYSAVSALGLNLAMTFIVSAVLRVIAARIRNHQGT
ncbi:solute:Na+ symporter, SSS family [Agrobacterium fabrum]|uniref:monocarboxylate uptake permease MctP n=1 Tax=Agrobacterium fabrum TaxID=1176649 RepID=UPI0008923DD9|nr:sodium:solute symporter [Agrobacterium fabrum]SDB74254.1 solute:Na+ symporter, SSS family [Agrobacterium fabrum]SES22042.1 solute:Na+ symporter, SSS family [Agrobacterium fabrum]